MTDDWRVWRPAIWLAMLGVAVALLVSPAYISAIFFGAAIGAAIRIQQRRRRRIAAADSNRAPASAARRSRKKR